MKKTLLGKSMLHFDMMHQNLGVKSLDTDIEANYFSDIKISLRMYDLDGDFENPTTIAYANITRIPSSFSFLNQKLYGCEYDMFEALDESGNIDLEVLGTELNPDKYKYSETETYLEDNNVYYVSHFKVGKEYRNQGVGKFFMKMLPIWIRKITGEYLPVITLIPAPIECKKDEEETYNEEKRRLIKFYQKVGFRKLRRTGTVMYYKFPENEYDI